MFLFVYVIINIRTFFPQRASVILKVRSALSVMFVVVSAAAGPTYQAGAVRNVHQELTALALLDANVREISVRIYFMVSLLLSNCSVNTV